MQKQRKPAILDKTPQETAKIVKKVLLEKLSEFKKSIQDETYTPGEAAYLVKQELADKISEFKQNLGYMQSLEKGETLNKVTPPNISEDLAHKLKDEYGHDKEGKSKAYATMWKISKRKKRKAAKKNEDSMECSEVAKGDMQGATIHPDPMLKDAYGLPNAPQSNSELAHKLSKNVFHMMGKMHKTNEAMNGVYKAGGMPSAESLASKVPAGAAVGATTTPGGHASGALAPMTPHYTAPVSMGVQSAAQKSESAQGKREEKELQDLRAKDSVLPGDKMPADANQKETGSGGQIGKGKQTQHFNKDEHAMVPPVKARISPILGKLPNIKPHVMQSQRVGSDPASMARGNMQTASLKAPLTGGTTYASPAAKGDYTALSQETMASKNAKMPAQQQSMKMPGAGKNSGRVESHGLKLPFQKDELMKEMDDMEKKMSHKKDVEKSY